MPEDDKGLMTRSEMIARLVFAMGGRSAEELVFHEPTTGASSDIDQATKIAKAMVTEYGMSARLGAVRYGREQGDPFLGRSMGNQPDYSLEVAHEIDEEVRALIEAAHTEAWDILNSYREVLDDLVFELLEKETLTRRDLERIFDRVEKRPRITAFNDFGGRTPSDKPPIQTPAERARERGEPWPPAIEPSREPTPVGSYPGGGERPPAARPQRRTAAAARSERRLPRWPRPAPPGRVPGRAARRAAPPRRPAGPGLERPAWSRRARPAAELGAAELRGPAGLAAGHHPVRAVLAAAGSVAAARAVVGAAARSGRPAGEHRQRARRPRAVRAGRRRHGPRRAGPRRAGPRWYTPRRPGARPGPGWRALTADTFGSAVNAATAANGGRPVMDRARAEAAVRELLLAIGEDPDREGLRDTPARVARAYEEIFSGLYLDADVVLDKTFDEQHQELILVKDIPVFSTCEHHLIPFHGMAHVGYIPSVSGRVTGLSKLARLVDLYARRPQVQERLTGQVADALVRKLDPRGVIVVIEAEHLCMGMRGIKKPGARTLTSAVRGMFQSSPSSRAEALSLIRGG